MGGRTDPGSVFHEGHIHCGSVFEIFQKHFHNVCALHEKLSLGLSCLPFANSLQEINWIFGGYDFSTEADIFAFPSPSSHLIDCPQLLQTAIDRSQCPRNLLELLQTASVSYLLQ